MTLLEQSLRKFAKDRLGYEIPSARLNAEILPKISKLSTELGHTSVDAFARTLSFMRETHPHFSRVVDILTINETSFFRQHRQLKALVSQCKELYTKLNRPIRVWCAACSSGEEAYSLSFLFSEESIPAEILGTDIHQPSLSFAKAGMGYPKYRARKMPSNSIQQYLIENTNGYDVRPEFKNAISFQYHNLISQPPPKLGHKVGHGTLNRTWDVIVCRNVFIYFPEAQVTEVARKMANSLSEYGTIWLGVNDTLKNHRSFLERRTVSGFRYFSPPTQPNKQAQRSVSPVLAQDKTKNSGNTGANMLNRNDRNINDGNINAPTWSHVQQSVNAGNIEQAQQLLTTLYRRRSGDLAKILCTQGVLFMHQHDFKSADACFHKAMIHNATEATIPYFRGVIAHKSQRKAEASSHFERCIALNDAFWPAHFLLGQYAHKSGNANKHKHLHTAKKHLRTPLGDFFDSVFPSKVESVHSNATDALTLINHYLSM